MGCKKGCKAEYMSEHPALFRARLRREGRHALLGYPFDAANSPPGRRPFYAIQPAMSSRGSGSASGSANGSRNGSGSGHGNGNGMSSLKMAKKGSKSRPPVQTLINYLTTHRVNTLTELCRIERVAASCDNESDARAFQGPMTSAWIHYVTSNQLLAELRGLTRSYPFSGDIVHEAHRRVRDDPESNRSWNLAWLCLTKMRSDGLVVAYAAVEAAQPEMWGGTEPSPDDVDRLGACFEMEWGAAVQTMLRHWPSSPTWC